MNLTMLMRRPASRLTARQLKFAAITIIALRIGVAAGADAERPATGIQDNSLLVEEAYDQEAGVVQHILNISPDIGKERRAGEHEWVCNFTQEWLVFGHRHQFTCTVPGRRFGKMNAGTSIGF